MGVLTMLFRPLFATVLIGLNYNSNSCVIRVVKKRGNSIVEDISNIELITDKDLLVDLQCRDNQMATGDGLNNPVFAGSDG